MKMEINVKINGREQNWEIEPWESLLRVLRREGYFGAKYGDDRGTSGMSLVLFNGVPRTTVNMLAAQADGAEILTIEGVGGAQNRGWKGSEPLHELQKAFMETGAIQCGYCTPAMILACKALLDQNPDPTEAEVRDALSSVLCRCTGYVKPVEAVLRAAAVLRGESVPDIQGEPIPAPPGLFGPGGEEEPRVMAPEPTGGAGTNVQTKIIPSILVSRETMAYSSVGRPEIKLDAAKLAQGKPAFADDLEMRGMLVGKLLLSPHAHARIRRIDASRARELPGVHAVLTHEDIPRVITTTAGQSDPIPGPLDRFCLDKKVRFVGDHVAAVAAETEEIAKQAVELIEVEYEVLPAVLDPEESMKPGAPLIHDEPEYVNFFGGSDPSRNVAAQIEIDIGDLEEGFKRADRVFEDTYSVPRVHAAPVEPYVCVSWWDEDDRLIIRSSTQVPFHARRLLAPVLGLPAKRIRVIKPRIGGGFGNKQEVLLEAICGHLTIVTGRPVRIEYTREEHFESSTTRHAMIMRVKTGVMNDGTIAAHSMHCLSDTGAYGNHAMTVAGNTGHKGMGLYNIPNISFHADIVYTNLTPSGAYRGYGGPQGFFAVETHLSHVAREMGLDPLEFRIKNALKPGDEHPLSKAWSEGREAHGETIRTSALPECIRQAASAIDWASKFGDEEWHTVPGKPHLRRGIGMAAAMHGTAIAYLDMGGASIKLNDDGSFNLLVGATDLGTGSDTVIAQMAAEVLGCPHDDFVVYSSDTDFTPFDKGAYASSTTYISGMAAVKAAKQVAQQMKEVAARLFTGGDYTGTFQPGEPVTPDEIRLAESRAWAPDGRSATFRQIALNSLHHENQSQIMGVGSHVSPDSPPPFAATFVEITLDTETGQITVDRVVTAVDAGVIVNPLTASGQIEGGVVQAIGYGVCEEAVFDEKGKMLNPRYGDYCIFTAEEMPGIDVIFVETREPTHEFGVKAVAEIPLDGSAPAIAAAVADAVGVHMKRAPMTPERVWRAIREAGGAE